MTRQQISSELRLAGAGSRGILSDPWLMTKWGMRAKSVEANPTRSATITFAGRRQLELPVFGRPDGVTENGK